MFSKLYRKKKMITNILIDNKNKNTSSNHLPPNELKTKN